MIEFLHFATSGFWVFFGVVILIGMILTPICNMVVRCVWVICGRRGGR